MLKVRVIPTLLMRAGALVKTVRFKKFGYIGDPVNTVRIFNELEVDELIFLDILASRNGQKPDFKVLSEIADECFMPLAYGGGVREISDIRTILNIGLEKVAINTYAMKNPDFVTQAADLFGSQCIIGSIDVKRDFWGRYRVVVQDGRKITKLDPVEWAVELERKGAGEILLTSVDRDGTWDGYDVDLIQAISSEVSIPVIANGGAGMVEHLGEAVKRGQASAVAVGSMVVYQKKGMGVLVNFPEKDELERVLS